MSRTGVYPVWENKFKISTTGRTSPAYALIADMENFSVSIDGNVEEWSPMEAEGWLRRMVTGKSLKISLSGKRNIGDAGNDYVANNAWNTGAGCETAAEWEFPSGAKLTFNCVLNVTNPGGGESRNGAPLEFEVLSDGKPTFTAAT